jgi:hypothetical protein
LRNEVVVSPEELKACPSQRLRHPHSHFLQINPSFLNLIETVHQVGTSFRQDILAIRKQSGGSDDTQVWPHISRYFSPFDTFGSSGRQ